MVYFYCTYLGIGNFHIIITRVLILRKDGRNKRKIRIIDQHCGPVPLERGHIPVQDLVNQPKPFQNSR